MTVPNSSRHNTLVLPTETNTYTTMCTMKKDQSQLTTMSSYIEGKQYLIPSLNETFDDWSRGINSGYNQLQSEMMKAVTRY
jgi:hypothetical protein